MGNVGYENGSVHSLTIPYPLSPSIRPFTGFDPSFAGRCWIALTGTRTFALRRTMRDFSHNCCSDAAFS